MKYFNVKQRGTFYIEVKECEDVAKLTDQFVTGDQLKELCGDRQHYYNKIYFVHKIKAAIEEWITIIPPNALSTTLRTSDVRVLLLEVNTDRLREYCPNGYSIKGSRLYNVTNCTDRQNVINEEVHQRNQRQIAEAEAQPYKREHKITHNDSWMLQKNIRHVIEKKHRVSISHHGTDDKALIKFGKKLCNWPEIKRAVRQELKLKCYLQDIKWIKKIWDNPDSYNRYR